MKRIMHKLIPLALTLLLLVAISAVCQAEEKGSYVLMNIPYEAFYAAEVTDASTLDAVSSSTLMKPRTGTLAGGSYHVDPEGSDISGVIFPVYVENPDVLSSLGGIEITTDSKAVITVTNKGEEKTTEYTGKDALFEAPSYSWYVLEEVPAQYKTLSVENAPAFSAVSTEAAAVEAKAAFVYDKHADIVIAISGLDDVLGDQPVSGVILTADDGTKVGLRHIANIWRGKQLGFGLDSAAYAALKGKTIVGIEYLTAKDHFTVSTDLTVAEDERLVKLSSTYIELFPEFAKEEYKDYWMECIQAYGLDDDMAAYYYTYLTQNFLGRLYGEEAIAAYTDPAGMVFDCFFENEIARVTVNGNVISGTDENGNELFRHTYAFVEDETVTFFGQEMPAQMHVYRTEDEDAGMFTYFAFSDDTLAETQHIEFRYGASLDNMASYSEGDYAYWLAAGIQDGYSDKLIKACIKLFVDENVGEAVEEAAAPDVIEISTAEELAAMNSNLSGHYVLTADIDLAGVEWTPVGTFMPSGESEEEQEIPAADYAFTGTFDGQGHTIRNLTVYQPEGWALGLFGVISETTIGNFTLENAVVDGSVMTADVVGYAYASVVSNVTLVNGTVHVHYTDMSAEGMYGGIVGAGMGGLIENCRAEAQIVIPDGTANAGIVGGGLEMTSVVDCYGTGTVTAGNNCYGLGGISGCGFGAEAFTGNTAENVTITAGNDCYWIGGITGYAGGYADYGVPVTAVSGCSVKNVTVSCGENAAGVGDIVGDGFYSEQVASLMGAPYDKPTEYVITDCTVE
ncbi:MAG: hypothetical protein IJ246_00385 [Clostridia bacterium]|nr:hypothetical protein [Clostridia bacterium]